MLRKAEAAAATAAATHLICVSGIPFAYSFVPSSPTSSESGIIGRSTSKAKFKTHLSAVTFRYSSSALDHLAALDDQRSPDKEDVSDSNSNNDNEESNAKLTATFGALGSMAATLAAFQAVGLPAEYEGISFLCGAAAAAAGYKLLGGDVARTQDLPKDGGYDAKFVVDKPGRVRDIVSAVETAAGDDASFVVVRSEYSDEDRIKAIRLINQVHDAEYVQELQDAVRDAEATDRIRRLHPVVMRTLIDKHSYKAAYDGVIGWIASVEAVMGDSGEGVTFAVSRPPSHHACRKRGMGGCLLNGPAIAAFRALELGAKNVAILDIDAHHGNGIANCVQGESRIRYCSLHEEVVEKNWFKSDADVKKKEESVDPRRPFPDDCGPLGNILNIPLEKGTRMDGPGGYREKLLNEALPFLMDGTSTSTSSKSGTQSPADVLILAAGFDALEADQTSRLALQTKDYYEIGDILRQKFGHRVVVGLEGGYVWQDGTLGKAVLELMTPFAIGI